MSDLSSIDHVTSGPAYEKLGLVHRVHVPPGDGPFPTLVMLHGLSGTEDVTWIFARAAGPEWLIISPRAPHPTKDGYSWNALDEEGKTDKTDLQIGLDALTHFIDALPAVYHMDHKHLVLLGFSQGAAMAHVYGTTHPVSGIASLAGFIPAELANNLPPLHTLPALILHGTKDVTVPISIARKNRDQLIAAGAKVTYLEMETGHKLSTAGMAELKRWLAERLVVQVDSPEQ